MISRTYHRIMNRNRQLMYIALKGSPDNYQEAGRLPRHLRELLTRYFTAMMEKKKLATPNLEMSVFSFMAMSYGVFFSADDGKEALPDPMLQNFIKEIRIFARALTPSPFFAPYASKYLHCNSTT